MTKEEKEFEEEYLELSKKYSLPEFKGICEDFDIEKILEKESTFLLREIRRAMNEKLAAYINLFETLINPASPPIFVFSILRGIELKDKEKMKEIYKNLARTQLEIMKLDTQYEEVGEARFIIKTFKIWQEAKPKILEIIESFRKNFEKSNESKKTSYFD